MINISHDINFHEMVRKYLMWFGWYFMFDNKIVQNFNSQDIDTHALDCERETDAVVGLFRFIVLFSNLSFSIDISIFLFIFFLIAPSFSCEPECIWCWMHDCIVHFRFFHILFSILHTFRSILESYYVAMHFSWLKYSISRSQDIWRCMKWCWLCGHTAVGMQSDFSGDWICQMKTKNKFNSKFLSYASKSSRHTFALATMNFAMIECLSHLLNFCRQA